MLPNRVRVLLLQLLRHPCPSRSALLVHSREFLDCQAAQARASAGLAGYAVFAAAAGTVVAWTIHTGDGSPLTKLTAYCTLNAILLVCGSPAWRHRRATVRRCRQIKAAEPPLINPDHWRMQYDGDAPGWDDLEPDEPIR